MSSYKFREEEQPRFKMRFAAVIAMILLLLLFLINWDRPLFQLSAKELAALEEARIERESQQPMTFRFMDAPEDDVELENPKFLSDANRVKKSLLEEQEEPENDDPTSQGNTYELEQGAVSQQSTPSPESVPLPPQPEQQATPEPTMEEQLPDEPEEPGENEEEADDTLKDVKLEDMPESQTREEVNPAGEVPTDPGAPKPFRRMSQTERDKIKQQARREMSALSIKRSASVDSSSFDNIRGSKAPLTGLSVETSRDDLGPYLKILQQLIRGNWRIPNIARLEVSGVAVVYFKINKDGTFRDAAIVRESGYEPLDASSLNAVINTIKAPPLPQHVDEEWIPIRFAFYYNMRPRY